MKKDEGSDSTKILMKKIKSELRAAKPAMDRGIKWKQLGSGMLKGDDKHKDNIKSHENIKLENIDRAAFHRRVNSSFKISDKVISMISMFKTPENARRTKTEAFDKEEHASDSV